MANYGKIARLPRKIRDELNRRLDDGEAGVDLVEWLNGLPSAKKVLQERFDGRPINEVNLTEWKNGGYLNWQAQQETVALAREFNAESEELAKLCGSDLTERLKTVVAVRYAALLQGWNGEITPEMRAKLRGMKGLTREIVRLRRCDRELERMQLDREALELKKQQTEEGIREKFEEWAADTDFREHITPKMTKREMDRALYRLIHGREKDEKEPNVQSPTSKGETPMAKGETSTSGENSDG
jgi:hypothetical protein